MDYKSFTDKEINALRESINVLIEKCGVKASFICSWASIDKGNFSKWRKGKLTLTYKQIDILLYFISNFYQKIIGQNATFLAHAMY